MFTGLSAFPLTPFTESGVDEKAFRGLVERLSEAGVDSIGALGSTGSYMYLDRQERRRVAELAVDAAGGTPVIIGIGALRTRDVHACAQDAQNAGAAGVLLAPVSYQQLTSDEVYTLFEEVTRDLSVPLCVYDNPATTHFSFSDELHSRIANLPNVRSIKIPGVPLDPIEAATRVASLRARIPAEVTIGVSGDEFAARGLNAGCEVWYSVLAGVLPAPCVALTRAAQSGDADTALELSHRFERFWQLFRAYGSLRVVSVVAEILGLVTNPKLPAPLQGLGEAIRGEIVLALDDLG
ncbi:dihydrodipicolinate synthase family protein [Nocardia sp. CA-084685]|uniref:dihydrodipicolinate synthase family protein n=1 Tax=Nocardia sp. CA-084685 TaxID=3239970 RepID=UPI003D98D7A1